MDQTKTKGDWEIIRIFLVLAVLTVGFVWIFQWLILAPLGVKKEAQKPAQAVIERAVTSENKETGP